MNRQGVVSRIDAAGMQLSQLNKELNELLLARYNELECLESNDYLIAVVSIDSALACLRQARVMLSCVGNSVEKQDVLDKFDIRHMGESEKQEKISQAEERKAA